MIGRWCLWRTLSIFEHGKGEQNEDVSVNFINLWSSHTTGLLEIQKPTFFWDALYMMFQTIQTIYFLWGYDPGNTSVFIAELSPVYCCLVLSWYRIHSFQCGIKFSNKTRKIITSHHKYGFYYWTNALHCNDAILAIYRLSLIKFASVGTPVTGAGKSKLK